MGGRSGVDTGKLLHAVVLREGDGAGDDKRRLVHLAVCRDFAELDLLMDTFQIQRCVIDGLPETHATRDFARRHQRRVYLNFFNENQRGVARWDTTSLTVQINRTEALDASRMAIRNREVILPRREPLIEEFARHLTKDAKVLEEDSDTGVKHYKYIRTGENHFSFAFTYAWMALTAKRRVAGVW